MTGSQSSLRNVISGFVLRLARETAEPPMSRDQLAAMLGVSTDTVAGWEAGRRPLSATQASQVVAIRHCLIRSNARPDLVSLIEQAIEADLIIDFAISAGNKFRPGDVHPLGSWVLRRELVDLIAWPLSTRVPAGLPTPTRRGPTPMRPALDAGSRIRFFDHLRHVVDITLATPDVLLRRQALYLLSFDARSDARGFLVAHRGRLPQGLDGWSSSWPAARSLAASITRRGDRTLLLDFISRGLADEQSQIANLNYWAYWVGEDRFTQRDDSFMGSGLGNWRGDILLRHLMDRLDPDLGYLELNIHTLWALLGARPRLLGEQPGVTAELTEKVERLLDENPESSQALAELNALRYALRLHR